MVDTSGGNVAHSGNGAMVAGRAKDVYAKLAKERQRDHGGTAPGKAKNTGGNSTTSVSDAGKARDQAGKVVTMSEREALRREVAFSA